MDEESFLKSKWLKNLVIYCICVGFVGAIFTAYGPLVPYWVETEHRSIEELAPLMAIRAIAYVCGTFIAKLLIGKYSEHQILGFSIFFASVMTLIFDFVDSMILKYFFYGLAFLAVGNLEMFPDIIALEIFSGYAVERALILFMGSSGVGCFLTPIIIGAVGVKTHLVLGLILFLSFPLIFFVRSPKHEDIQLNEEQIQEEKLPLPTISFVIGCICYFLNQGGSMVFSNWLSTYIVKRELTTKEEAVIINTVFWVVVILCRILFSLFPGKPEEKLKILTFLGAIVPIFMLFLIYMVDVSLGLYLGTILTAVTLSINRGLFQAQIQKYGFKTSKQQYTVFFFFLGMSDGPYSYFVKLLCDWINWEMLFYSNSIIFLISFILVLWQGRILSNEFERHNKQKKKYMAIKQAEQSL